MSKNEKSLDVPPEVYNNPGINYGKSGKKIAGADTHYDHAAKQNCSKYVWGHCRVVIGILKSIHGRWACLPLAQSLYIPARKQESVENHFELCCMAVTMTWIYAMKREKAPTKRLQNSRTFTFSDIREEIRKEYTDKSIHFSGVCSKTLKQAGNIILNSFFREVA